MADEPSGGPFLRIRRAYCLMALRRSKAARQRAQEARIEQIQAAVEAQSIDEIANQVNLEFGKMTEKERAWARAFLDESAGKRNPGA